MYDCPCWAKYFVCIQSEPLFQHLPFVSHSLAHATVLIWAPVSLGILYEDWKAAVRSPHSLPFLQAEQAPLPHPLLRARPPAPTTLVILQNPGSLITSLNWGRQNWTQSYKSDLLGAEQKGIIPSLDAALFFTQTRMLLAVFVARDVAGSCPVYCSPGPLGLFGRAAPQPLPLQCLKHEIIALFI